MRGCPAEVFSMLGPGERRFARADAWADAWAEPEAETGTEFPEDYKAAVDAYVPMQLNGHLYPSHPATEHRNPGRKIRETSQVWAEPGTSTE
ncbi:hypothetical protein [Kitasatospora sp. NPDC054795]